MNLNVVKCQVRVCRGSMGYLFKWFHPQVKPLKQYYKVQAKRRVVASHLEIIEYSAIFASFADTQNPIIQIEEMIKSITYALLFQCFLVCPLNKPVQANDPKSSDPRINQPHRKEPNAAKEALRIVKKNTGLPVDIHQLLVVFNQTPEQNMAVLVVMEKERNDWKVVSPPIEAGIGRKGFAAPNTKREGDEKSPTGLFRLGQLFCYEEVVDTRMQFIHTTPEDKWIDDPGSPDYNRYIRGTTSAKSYEKLLLNGNDYRYCMAIEYNTHPVVKGMGSAIFLHLSEGKTINSSSGCVVLLQKDMERLLKWMNPESKPSILMGSEKVLVGGLKSKK